MDLQQALADHRIRHSAGNVIKRFFRRVRPTFTKSITPHPKDPNFFRPVAALPRYAAVRLKGSFSLSNWSHAVDKARKAADDAIGSILGKRHLKRESAQRGAETRKRRKLEREAAAAGPSVAEMAESAIQSMFAELSNLRPGQLAARQRRTDAWRRQRQRREAQRMAPYQPPRGRATRGASVDGYRIRRRADTYSTQSSSPPYTSSSDEFVEQFLTQTAGTSGGVFPGFVLDLD